MRIAIAQLNPTVGDLSANLDTIAAAADDAGAQGADLVIVPELALTGCPTLDLPAAPSFVRDGIAALARLAESVRGPTLVCGAITSATGDPLELGEHLANAAVVIRDGAILACHRKRVLRESFGETHHFVAGDRDTRVSIGDLSVGLSVGADIARAGPCDLLVNIAASPFALGKAEERIERLAGAAVRLDAPVVMVNQVGGNDGHVFDGRSLAVDPSGAISARAPAFEEHVLVAELRERALTGSIAAEVDTWEADVVDALCLGLADYVAKCGFSDVVVGLSGGIDSALTCALAVRALGSDHVIGVSMPAQHSSKGSRDDAHALADTLGIRLDTVPIAPIFDSFTEAVAPGFAGLPTDVTEENLQARIRGTLLMAYSNKLGGLLLATGNRSEVAVGYATLYGDMCGGLAVIADLYKTEVYALSRTLNRGEVPPIPQASIDKPPSAELLPGQTDQDSLPPYDALDAVLAGWLDDRLGRDEIVAAGHPPEMVDRVLRMVRRAEHKRRQAAPGLLVRRRPFPTMPVARG